MRFFLAFVVALATMLSVTSAFAQATISVVNEASLPRLDKNGNTINKRAQNLTPEGISLQDCLDDQRIRFTVQMAGFDPQSSIQMWASRTGSCSEQTARSGGTQVCWRLVASDLARATTQDVDVPVRAIMSGVAGTPAAPVNNAEMCGKVDLATISVQILYFAPGQAGAKASGEKAISVTADTVGPDPPSGLKTLPGNKRIHVTWTTISGGGTEGGTGGVVALTGVNAYCDVNSGEVTKEVPNEICRDVANEAPDASVDDSGDASVVDAGTTRVCIDGGTTTETTGTACGSSNFVDPAGGKKFPDREFNAKFACGSITGDTGQGIDAEEIAGVALENGTNYAVAVAATDAFGNVGPLSEPVCETPAETTDFWEQYRAAGGGAGGGCATTSSSAPIGAMSIIAMIAATVFRRRKDRR